MFGSSYFICQKELSETHYLDLKADQEKPEVDEKGLYLVNSEELTQ